MSDKLTKYDRRDFFKFAGYAALSLVYLSVPRWMRAAAKAMAASSGKTLVVLFQRGAADGLNMVVPYRDANYHRLRPTIGLKAPGQANGVLDLDGHFGLHPALAPLLPLWKQRKLALIHAAGCPEGTRSHFDAQDNMETGTPGLKSTPDGWMNRALDAYFPANHSPLAALAIGPRLPRILRGQHPVTSISSLQSYRFAGGMPAADSFEKMYERSVDLLLSGAGEQTGESVKTLQDIFKKNQPSSPDAKYAPGKLAQGFADMARVIKADQGMRLGFLDVGGWDHHFGEGSTDGLLNQRLTELGSGLAAFYRDLGDRADEVLVVTMTEFGRTVEENGDRGTDHGHGGVMMLMGGGVKGGKLYGRWPGLDKEALFEGRDLEVTTDFRQVYAEVISKHFGFKSTDKVFPNYQSSAALGIL
jgi:uncharacterized protein (DUF1501 family)